MTPVSLIFSFRFPGQYALTVLAGAVESQADLRDVTLHFPRRFEDLRAVTRREVDAGRRVVVAWSFYSPSLPECADELSRLRASVGPGFLAIAGGVHATAEPLETLRAGFDWICVGEGEVALTALLRRLQSGEDVARTPGFARLEAGVVRQNPKPPRIELDDFPPFAPGLRRFGAIELTRGCIYACRFCQTPFFSKARFRHRSVEGTARWAKALAEAAKPDVRFVSPTSMSYGSQDESVNLAAVEALLAKVREAVGPAGRIFFGTFPSEVRPEHVTPEALAVLKRFVDNDNLVIGGQSGSQTVLEASRRGHDVEAIVRAARVALEAGFRPNVDFILGLPGESPDDVRATVALMKQLAESGARVHGHTFMPLPGTPFRDAPPGAVDEETRVELERLASAQRLYGHWKAQQVTARALARRRDERR